MDEQIIITVISALLAAASFALVALPFLNKNDEKERYRSVIEKRRKDLFDATKDGSHYKAKGDDLSAKDSMAGFYKVQQLAGKMGEEMRDKLLQAGVRDPSAPLKFMIAKGVAPVFLTLVLMSIFSSPKAADVSDTVVLFTLLGAAFFGYKLPDILIKNQIQKRQIDINLAFPDSLDMMLICVQGGIGLEQTVDRVAEEISEHSPTLAEELGILSAEMAMLNDRRQALQDFARRVGSGAGKTFATSLIQAEQYGTSVSQAMRVMADELREMRMSAAEEKAMSLPPKLTVPMILCFLPALFIVILGPAGIQATSM